jgi:hypothetical protein
LAGTKVSARPKSRNEVSGVAQNGDEAGRRVRSDAVDGRQQRSDLMLAQLGLDVARVTVSGRG